MMKNKVGRPLGTTKKTPALTEERLRFVIENWGKLSNSEIGRSVGVTDTTISQWGGRIRAMLENEFGMSPEDIVSILPKKRKTYQEDIYRRVLSGIVRTRR